MLRALRRRCGVPTLRILVIGVEGAEPTPSVHRTLGGKIFSVPRGSGGKAIPQALCPRLTDVELRADRGNPVRRKHHALPNRRPQPPAHPPFPAGLPQEPSRAAGGRRKIHAQLGRERRATHGSPPTSSVARPCLRPASVAVRAKPTVPHTAPTPRTPSAIRPWTPQHSAPQRYKVDPFQSVSAT